MTRHAGIGVVLAERLGLGLTTREGRNLAGPCLSCKSHDAFRLHIDKAVGYCHSCKSKWSPLALAEQVLGNRQAATQLLVELGIFQARDGDAAQGNGASHTDPIELIARQKGVTADALRAFGATKVRHDRIRLPAYGPNGKRCTSFTLSTKGGKGLFARGQKAGLFFPHVDGNVRLPKHGEVWHLVEGPKDASALHALGLLACGLNTCCLHAKFGRLFRGVDVVLVPDRDRAGVEGAGQSARVLHGIARTVRVAVLPAEFKESGGEDVRDILRRPDGRDQVLQAIADAEPVEYVAGESEETSDEQAPSSVTAQIPLDDGEPLTLDVHAALGKPQRLLVARRGEVEFRDRIDTNSSISRQRFIKHLAQHIGVSCESLTPLVERELTRLADQVDALRKPMQAHADEESKSQATLAAELADEWQLWHSPAGDAFATVPINGHEEYWPVRSQTFRRILAKHYFDKQHKVMNAEAMGAAIGLIEAKALFEGEEHAVHVRVAGHGESIYLDLCNPDWQAVEITVSGWRVVDTPKVKFRRSRGMLPLPVPERGGSVDQLREFLNLDDDAWMLTVAWLVASLRPRGPYAILALFAEQGSGKSTAGRMLRSLVDPNAAPLRSEPRDIRDLMIAATNSWCLTCDNLSYIPAWLSDALCRISTGGGHATRELYTDLDEIIFDVKRPVLLTSIEEVASRADLLDRCLIVWLAPIPESTRRAEDDLVGRFDSARPRILGALLDVVAGALQAFPTVKLDGLPRMADFAKWVSAAEPSLGWSPGTFMQVYSVNRASANELALEASVIARPLLDLLNEAPDWTGTATELLETLSARVPDELKRQRAWPTNGRGMSGHLKRLAPNLRAAGWDVSFDREPGGVRRRTISFREYSGETVPTVPIVPNPQNQTQFRDASDSAGTQTQSGGTQQAALFSHDGTQRDGRDGAAGILSGTGAPNNWEEGEL